MPLAEANRRATGSRLSACFATPRSFGGVKRATLARGEGRKNFDTFFASFGPLYDGLLKAGSDVHTAVRCGMAHEFLVKGKATISMLKGAEWAGMMRLPNGR
jgi:hypothetical protein